MKSKLILKTFDGTMKNANISPKCDDSKIEFHIKYYNEKDILTKAVITFNDVIAIDFEVNYFDNFISSELYGFYEIFEEKAKINMIEKIFKNRLEGYLYHGDYSYDHNNENDMLNYMKPLKEIINKIDEYRLFQQQTQGGIYYILSSNYKIYIEI